MNKNHFTLVYFTFFCLALTPVNALTTQQQKMLDQLDQLERLDHIEFLDLNNEANSCILSHDFTCAENKIAKAKKLANSSSEKTLLQNTQLTLQNERQRIADEERLRAQEERRLAEAEEEMERARRRAQEEENNEPQESIGEYILKTAQANAAYLNNIDRQINVAVQQANQAKARERERAQAEAERNARIRMEQQRAQIEANRIARDRLERQRQAELQRQQQLARNTEIRIPTYESPRPEIEKGRTQCPPGSSPARQKNGFYVTNPPEAYCIKDPSYGEKLPLTTNTNTSSQSGSSSQYTTTTNYYQNNGSLTGNSLMNKNQKDIEINDSFTNKKKKEVQMGPIQLEAIAICRQSQKSGKWVCNGALDNQIIVDEPTLESALARQRCSEGTWAAGGPTIDGVKWEAYACGHALGHGDYDVAKRHGLITARRSYQCVKGQPSDGRCAVFYGK